MRDRERLARLFEVSLTPIATPIIVVGGLFLSVSIPAALVVGGGAFALFGASRLNDERRIRAGLAEVNRWGFPVVGYREWLLAEQPTFDVELQRETSLDVVRSSTEAVDRTIIVERRSERVVRFVTRPVQLSLD